MGQSNRSEAEIRAEILALTRELHDRRSAEQSWTAGEDYLGYGGRVFEAEEMLAAVDATLDMWLTMGPEGEAFQRELAAFLGVRWSLLMNSGSSANLVAASALTSPKVRPRLRPGDEVITVAAGFPTTVAPILQVGAVPVFLDTDVTTGNARLDQLEEALSGRTRAVMMAHTLGNPFDLDVVTAFCAAHDLFFIEDNCDALGSRWKGQLTGSFGDLSTQSFYPPHHITMGEGGAVNIRENSRLKVAAESFRDWGRDCWCAAGKEDTCRKRFGWKLGDLPEGYDHKYIYSHLGYNLKPLDIQAAIGRVQLGKVEDFAAARRRNHAALAATIAPYRGVIRTLEATEGADPAWFAFLMIVEPGAPFTRSELAQHLEENKVATRMLFGGNLLRQPAFTQLVADAKDVGGPAPYRVIGELEGADRLLHDAVFVGTYPGIDQAKLDWMCQVLRDFLQAKTGGS